jgi:hypothetical protein
MSNYRKSIGKTFEFEGDKVRVIVTPMKRKDALKIIPLLNIDTETGKAQLTLENQYQILDVAADLLPKSIKEFQGLKDNEGQPMTFEEAANEMYFIELISDIVQFVMSISFISGGEEKKSGEPPVNSTAVSEATNVSNFTD